MSDTDPAATSFGAEASAYERGRPSYPADAVTWLLADAPRRVVDVGAGTGKLTRALLGDGREVVAVDPDAEMLAALSSSSPEVVALVGTAESIPLEDASADLVVLGQAWHWVDPDAAAGEIARVLAPAGSLALIWNVRDESSPWVARLTEGRASTPRWRCCSTTSPSSTGAERSSCPTRRTASGRAPSRFATMPDASTGPDLDFFWDPV
ncbi:class I SAM-dependent methyltransferase [Ilumatobacter sp.]|uniref:class I SAM-dependent methyltransferase n=1 Tax=Ilumatobacter sp. TaxID=1967498 RepID=UPI003B525005